MTGKAIVFDSWPIMAVLQNEDAAISVKKILKYAELGHQPVFIHPVNMGEVWYNVARRYGKTRADFAIEIVTSAGIELYEPDWNCYRKAAEFKMRGGISYADCMAAALAFTKSATLVTGDFEFKKIEEEVEILWLR